MKRRDVLKQGVAALAGCRQVASGRGRAGACRSDAVVDPGGPQVPRLCPYRPGRYRATCTPAAAARQHGRDPHRSHAVLLHDSQSGARHRAGRRRGWHGRGEDPGPRWRRGGRRRGGVGHACASRRSRARHEHAELRRVLQLPASAAATSVR